MDKQNALKLCPFCGGKAQVVVSRNFGIVYTVECHNGIECPLHYLRTKSFYTKAEAIKAWNRRVDDGREEVCKIRRT